MHIINKLKKKTEVDTNMHIILFFHYVDLEKLSQTLQKQSMFCNCISTRLHMQIKHQSGCVYKPGLNSVRVLLTEESVTWLSTSIPTETSK